MAEIINENTVPEQEYVQTEEETDKKCPKCGGIMEYDPKENATKCPYCDYSEKMPKVYETKAAEELEFVLAAHTKNCRWGEKTKTVICKSCGAETVYDELQLASECPYCGSNQVMEETAEDRLAPNGVIPFTISKDVAGTRFYKWLKKKIFCPRAAKMNAKHGKFSGIYVPYWTFDSKTSTNYIARYGKTKTYRDSSGNTRTVTEWYSTSGDYNRAFNDVAVRATTRQDGKLLSQIEPYRTELSVEYSPKYLAGYTAECYTTGVENGFELAKGIMNESIDRGIRDYVINRYGASQVTILKTRTAHSDVTFKYLMLPVWLSTFKYKNKQYNFAVNGQTGKVGGKAPVSALRVTIAVILGIGLAVLAWYLISKYI